MIRAPAHLEDPQDHREQEAGQEQELRRRRREDRPDDRGTAGRCRDEPAVDEADEQDEQADAGPDGALEGERDGVHHRFPEADHDEQRDDETLEHDDAHRALRRQAARRQRERDDGVDAKAGGDRQRVVPDHAHGDGHDPGDQGRPGRDRGDAGWIELEPGAQDRGVDEDDVDHDEERRQAGARLRRDVGAALLELEVAGQDRSADGPRLRCRAGLRFSAHLSPILLARWDAPDPTCGLGTRRYRDVCDRSSCRRTALTPRDRDAARPSGYALLVLAGFEAEQLHLDETAGVERQLAWGERRVVDLAGSDRGELHDHPLVALDERVDEQLIGPGLEFEVLERVDVEGDRQAA